MRLLYICYAFLIVTGTTALNYRLTHDDYASHSSASSSGTRLGSGTFGSSHK